MEQDPSNNENTERLLDEQKKRIEALELAFIELERKAARYEEGWSAQFDQNKELCPEELRILTNPATKNCLSSLMLRITMTLRPVPTDETVWHWCCSEF